MASESGGHLAQEAKDQRTPANDLSVQVGAKGVVAWDTKGVSSALPTLQRVSAVGSDRIGTAPGNVSFGRSTISNRTSHSFGFYDQTWGYNELGDVKVNVVTSVKYAI